MDPDATAELRALVAARAPAWSETTLTGLAAATLDPELEALLLRRRVELARSLPDGGDLPELRAHLVRWLRRRNQFIELDAAALAQLDAVCAAGLRATATALASDDPRAALRAVFRSVRAALGEFVVDRLGAEPREVVSGEYSAALQLEVLGLQLDTLGEPVLDVGCGPQATLVLALRAAGLQAEGIDRDAPATATVADWLQYAYGSDRWGAVISHLGFSLHLLHHHLAGRQAAFVHAEVYMQILRSLRVGGVFAYAPGLPFLERLLPRAQYEVTRGALPQSSALRAGQADTGLALGLPTRVRRRG